MVLLRKRSLNLAGHETSVALEQEFWSALEEWALQDCLSIAALVRQIDAERADRPLASACRIAALGYAARR